MRPRNNALERCHRQYDALHAENKRLVARLAEADGAVDLLRWALLYVPEPTKDMGSCEYVENYAQALQLTRGAVRLW